VPISGDKGRGRRTDVRRDSAAQNTENENPDFHRRKGNIPAKWRAPQRKLLRAGQR